MDSLTTPTNAWHDDEETPMPPTDLTGAAMVRAAIRSGGCGMSERSAENGAPTSSTGHLWPCPKFYSPANAHPCGCGNAEFYADADLDPGIPALLAEARKAGILPPASSGGVSDA